MIFSSALSDASQRDRLTLSTCEEEKGEGHAKAVLAG